VKIAAAGLGLTVLVTALAWLVWGEGAIFASGIFGLLATLVQTAAVLIVRPVWKASFDRFAVRWLAGIGLRLLGVAAIVLAVLVGPDQFPPLPTAFAYLGVLIPLLFTETRFLGDARNA
jgi:hypothetical protein